MRWARGGVNSYRVGAQGKFDLVLARPFRGRNPLGSTFSVAFRGVSPPKPLRRPGFWRVSRSPEHLELQRKRFVVAGAGSGSVNGRYACVGYANGRPLYRREQGGAVLFFEEKWKISQSSAARMWHYQHPAPSEEPPTGPWALSSLGEVAAPAPSVFDEAEGQVLTSVELGVLVRRGPDWEWQDQERGRFGGGLGRLEGHEKLKGPKWPMSLRSILLWLGWTTLVFISGNMLARQSCGCTAVYEEQQVVRVEAVPLVRPNPAYCEHKQRGMSLEELAARADSLSWGYPESLRRYIRLLGLSLTGTLLPHGQSELEPFNETARWCGNDWPKLGLTMVGFERLKNVAQLLIDVIANKVPGAFAELGVWRGGTCIFAKLLFDAMAEPRAVHVFDAFARIASYAKASQDFLSVKEDNIPKWFKLYGAYDRNVHIHKGLFRDTLPAFRENASHAGAKIAVLRVDGNHHDSYQGALYNLYGLVPVGGYVTYRATRVRCKRGESSSAIKAYLRPYSQSITTRPTSKRLGTSLSTSTRRDDRSM